MFQGLPPIEPSAGHREAAAATFGLFKAYVDAGFNDDQALTLLMTLLANASRRGGDS